jgi:hypothetical protein
MFSSACRCILVRLPFWNQFSQEHAFEPSQKYKEGKFIVEKARILKVRHVASSFFISSLHAFYAVAFVWSPTSVRAGINVLACFVQILDGHVDDVPRVRVRSMLPSNT